MDPHVRGRGGSAVVPHLVGLPFDAARELATAAGVVLTSGAPDGPPVGLMAWPGTWVVARQWTPPGARVTFGALVVVELVRTDGGGGGGGDSGDREPRMPVPPSGLRFDRLRPPPGDLLVERAVTIR